MTCVHLQQLFKLCQDQKLKLGGSDLIRVVCHQCGLQEVCPSTLILPTPVPFAIDSTHPNRFSIVQNNHPF